MRLSSEPSQRNSSSVKYQSDIRQQNVAWGPTGCHAMRLGLIFFFPYRQRGTRGGGGLLLFFFFFDFTLVRSESFIFRVKKISLRELLYPALCWVGACPIAYTLGNLRPIGRNGRGGEKQGEFAGSRRFCIYSFFFLRPEGKLNPNKQNPGEPFQQGVTI